MKDKSNNVDGTPAEPVKTAQDARRAAYDKAKATSIPARTATPTTLRYAKSIRQLADLCGVNKQAVVEALARKDGAPVKTGKGYKLAAWLQYLTASGALDRSQDAKGETSGEGFGDKRKYETQIKRFQSKLTELEYLEAKKTLIDRAEAENDLLLLTNHYVKALESLPKKILAKTGNKDIADLVGKCADEIRNEIIATMKTENQPEPEANATAEKGKDATAE
jgi:hypothetical protein